MRGEAGSVDPNAVRTQLDRILASPDFSGAARISAFLRFVVEEALEGRADRLKGYAVGLEVFGRDESFDPQTDPVVRVEAGRLRRRLREYYLTAGQHDPIHIEIPRGRYAPVIQSQDELQTEPAAPAAVPGEAPTRHGPSIAVMPFQNYGADPGDQFFADGLTEETVANLARFRDLFVFSRTTTASLAKSGTAVSEIHERLGADFVLEGSVRKTAQVARVTIQLIDATTDGHLLAEQFDRPCTPEAIFEIQDEIAQLVASRVADRYGPLGRSAGRASRTGRSARWETYGWITRFYDYYATHNPERHQEIRTGLPRALEADPDSSDGWAALALVLLDEYRLHINQRQSYPALENALEHSLRAVTCDPENAFAYQVLALVYFHLRELTDFEIAAERAVKLNPGHADVLADIGFCYCVSGDWSRGIPMLERAIELSPIHPGWYRIPLAMHRMLNGDANGAIRELKWGPMVGHHWYHALLAWFFAERGDEETTRAELSALLSVFPDFAELARAELKIWGVYDDLVARAVAGWRKAGLEID